MERNDILTRARECFDSAADFRRRRERQKRFTYGEQWADTVACADGKTRTERDLATMRGRTPLTNNMIRNLVKTIVGHFRADSDEAGANAELDARTLEEFLISGAAIHRVWRERRPDGSDCQRAEWVSPSRFFHSPFSDPRGLDVELVGMLHDWSLPEVLARFSGGSRSRAEQLRRHFGNMQSDAPLFHPSAIDFTQPATGRCRVVEVWTLEAAERLRVHDPLAATFSFEPPSAQSRIDSLNRRRTKARLPRVGTRWEMTMAWHGRWLSPQGLVLAERESSRHPFAFRLYPMIDGEIHSFVEDVIDQQKYINRLITHVDNMMSTSAKGVLLFPQDQLGDDVEWRDVADAWASYDGIIPYNPRPGVPGPQQVVTNPAPCGAYELLSLQMKMMEDVSGVSPAYRGKAVGGSGNSAQLYEAQARYAGVALADLFATFRAFQADRDRLLE